MMHPSGITLITDVNMCDLGPRQIAIWWLGQHSFIVKTGRTVIYIDPFLTPMPERLVPPLLIPQQIKNATLICGSHDHADHIDRPVWPGIAMASSRAMFVVPDLLRDRLAVELGISNSRFIGLDDATYVDFAGIRITGIAAAHEMLDRDPTTGKHPYLGFVFESPAGTWYHAGDTCWYEGLQTRLSRWKFDFMLVPINGRDAKRLSSGIIGNMTYQEAADLCGPLSPKLVVPTHYDMFAANLGDPQAFQDYMRVKYPRVSTQLCSPGERLIVGG